MRIKRFDYSQENQKLTFHCDGKAMVAQVDNGSMRFDMVQQFVEPEYTLLMILLQRIHTLNIAMVKLWHEKWQICMSNLAIILPHVYSLKCGLKYHLSFSVSVSVCSHSLPLSAWSCCGLLLPLG